MDTSSDTLEPLASYLAPRFGNIYEYNLASNDPGFEMQPWTPELQEAVTQYLVHEVKAEDWEPFLEQLDHELPDDTRAEQAAFIITHDEPWVVAYAFHLAALKAVPTLDQLIGQLDTWPDASLQEDVGVWLNAHASDEQLAELAEIVRNPGRNPATPWFTPEPTGWDLAENLMPPALLNAWNHVVGPARSDLTDDEWRLLAPLLPERRNQHGALWRPDYEFRSLRVAFDGIRYKFTHDDIP